MTYKSSLADIFEMKFEKTANQYELVSTAFPELSKAQKDDYENVRKEYAHRLKTISDSFRETEWIYKFESKIPNGIIYAFITKPVPVDYFNTENNDMLYSFDMITEVIDDTSVNYQLNKCDRCGFSYTGDGHKVEGSYLICDDCYEELFN